MNRGFLAGAGFVLMIGSAGCDWVSQKIGEKVAEKAIESASGGKVDVDAKNGKLVYKDKDETLELDGKKGSYSLKNKKDDSELQVGKTAKLPDGFPSLIKLYPGSKILASYGGTNKGKSTYSLTLSTDAGMDKVTDFYKSLADFEVKQEMNSPVHRMLGLKHSKEKLELNAMIMSKGQQSTIQLSVTDG
ncbi:MAG: hypothetical protein IPJ88_04490 [Myxococcales bacterium]|nr:MAG: hypothetical protein IPJ88_04490 [Myxococcales bacterium]